MPDDPVPPADAPAPVDPPRNWERTVYNMFYRVLGHRKTAKRLTRLLGERGVSPDDPVTFQARDLVRTELPQEYSRSLFAKGRELLSKPPDLEDIPRLGPGFDSSALEKEVKDALPREHLAVLELLFVDRRPVSEVAELVGVHHTFLITFIVQVVDILGDLNAIAHDSPDGCPHPLHLIRSRIESALVGMSGRPDQLHEGGGSGRSRRDRDDQGCEGCRAALTLTEGMLDLFSRDSRILSLGDEHMLRKAIEGPRVKVSEPVDPFKQPLLRSDKGQDRNALSGVAVQQALPAPNPWVWKLTGGFVAFLLFYAAFSAFSSFTGPSDSDQAGFKKGLKTLQRDSLGTYSDLTSPSKELIAHSTLAAGPQSPLYLSFHSGVQVELSASSSATVQANRVRLIRGRARIRFTEGPQGGFFINVGELVGRLKEGDLYAAMLDASPVRFSLRAGILDVKDGRGRRYRLEPSNVMKASGNGLSYTVEEGTVEDLASVEPPGAPAAAPGATADEGTAQ